MTGNDGLRVLTLNPSNCVEEVPDVISVYLPFKLKQNYDKKNSENSL